MWNVPPKSNKFTSPVLTVDQCPKCGRKMTCLFSFYVCDKCEPAKPSAYPTSAKAPAKKIINVPLSGYVPPISVTPTTGTTWYAYSTKDSRSQIADGNKVTKDLPQLQAALQAKATKDGKPRYVYAIIDTRFDPNDENFLDVDSGTLATSVDVQRIGMVVP